MELFSLKYSRNQESNKSGWQIVGSPSGNDPLTFGNINLIVGRNAAGKSNTIKAVRDLADLLSGEKKPSDLIYTSGMYDVVFKNGSETLSYYLEYQLGKVIDEKLIIENKTLLDRKNKLLFYKGLNNMLAFKTDDNVLAITRRDEEQQDFFNILYYWGLNLSHYSFGTALGKDVMIRDVSLAPEDSYNLKETDKVSGLFIKGISEYKDLKAKVIDDMKNLDYDILNIEANRLKHFPINAYGLSVNEKGLEDYTDQQEMSQGMFRALSLIVQINYSLLSNRTSCILIDDIGEGLDFSRSQSLINLIIEKVQKSNLQVIMTSNDRFIMNNIPLSYWHVIKRDNNKSIFYNENNSKDIFESFAYTGLNNFDFFSTNFYQSGLQTFN